jgi:hypothetical protein
MDRSTPAASVEFHRDVVAVQAPQLKSPRLFQKDNDLMRRACG